MSNENLNQPDDGEQVRDAKPEAGADSAPADGRGDATAEPQLDTEGDELAEELPVISDEELQTLLADAMNAATASDSPASDEDAPAEAEANPHLEDLLRVQAEYANYRRRTDREKEELGDAITARVVKNFLPVLDDLGRAEQAGDLEEGSALQVIAAKLVATIERLGVERYGEAGEPFDPTQHEAIAQLPNPAVESETIADVVEYGYRIGEIELRPAKVAVFVPAN